MLGFGALGGRINILRTETECVYMLSQLLGEGDGEVMLELCLTLSGVHEQTESRVLNLLNKSEISLVKLTSARGRQTAIRQATR